MQAQRSRARREIMLALALLAFATVTRLLLGDPQVDPAIAAAEGGPQLTTPHPQPPGSGMSLAAANAFGERGIPCYATPARGSRHLRVFYTNVTGSPDRSAELRGQIRADIAATDGTVDASAGRTGGIRHLRLDTGADCVLRVEQVSLPRTMNPTEIRQHLVGLGALRGDEKAIVYADWTAPSNICGWSEVYSDDQPGPSNINNRGSTAAVTFTACVSRGTTGHEVMHTLGGVQHSAPNSTGGFHCTDEYDRMCYPDGRNNSMTYPCAAPDNNQLFDCNGDDFFSVTPTPGSYLATHWNVANSEYWERSDPARWDTGGAPAAASQPTTVQPISPLPQPATPPPPRPTTLGGFDDDPATTGRVDRADPVQAAVAVSEMRFAAVGTSGRRARHAVLSRNDTFPDSLAGASLTSEGPLLLTDPTGLSSTAAAELQRALTKGATVYLLGGEQALSPAVAEAVATAGYRPVRLAGASRVETALAVADEVRRLHPHERRVAAARAFGPSSNPTAAWADAVSGGAVGATGVPILVVPTEGIPASVSAWLAADRPATTILFGGTAALSPVVEAAVPNPQRVSGADRAGTAAAIARALWPAGTSRYVLFHGTRQDGWAFGLAAAGLSADAGAPLLVVDDGVPAATAELLVRCGSAQLDTLLLGAGSVIGDNIRDQVDRLDGATC